MWITALRPQALENEIIQTNRYKVLVFGSFEQLENQKVNWQTTAKPCQDNEAELAKTLESQTTKWQNIQTQINNYHGQVQKAQEEIQNLPLSQSHLLLKKLATTNQDYLQKLTEWKSQSLNQSQLITKWQIQVNKFCISGLETQTKMLPELKDLLFQLSELKDLDSWQKNNQNWLKSGQKLVENQWTQNGDKPEIKQIIEQFKDQTAKIFELKIDQPNLGTDFTSSLQELESWEAEQIKILPHLEKNLIFLVNKKR